MPNQHLNKNISENELNVIIKKLKKKKAVGFDQFSNEIFKNAPKIVLQMILLLLIIILEKGRIPEQWCKGLITPIYKKGDKLNPDNHRGRCVANALLKILCLILNKRLQDHINEKRLINKGQIGFVPKCRTTDHLFTLKHLLKYMYVIQMENKFMHASLILKKHITQFGTMVYSIN